MNGDGLGAVGPAALTTGPTLGSSAGFLETQQRNGIVSVHPGGTTDIQRVHMARRIGIGRSTREKAGTVHGAERAMDLALTESQEMLRTTARTFMEREAPVDVVVGLQKAESSLDRDLWAKAARLGWL